MCCFLLVEVVDLDFCFLTLTILQLLIISLYAFNVILCHWKPGGKPVYFGPALCLQNTMYGG